MTENSSAKGPDLVEGVPAADIGEGAMLAGLVGEEAVLVARVGGALFAIGAECTHYHGPLAEGLIKDGAVRCPWHHARFCLKTGEAVGAPAFDPVACYDVEERGGRVRVTGKRTVGPQAAKALGDSRRVVIVGGGAGGFAAAEMLRRKGHAGQIVMLSADVDAPYDRPNCSKDFLSGDAPDEWMPLRGDEFYKEQGIELRLRSEVESLDLDAKSVRLKGGETLAYEVLILATGGEPRRPSIPGLEDDKAFVLRTLDDARVLARAAESATRVAIVGASFIAMEAAAALRKRGLAVSVVAPEGAPFERVLGAEVGAWARAVHEKQGVVFYLGRQVRGFRDGALTLDDGSSVEADLVVLGTGVKPRTALAEAAGLEVHDGVVVDDRLRAAPDIYAIGDIARYPEPISGALARVEHWVHAERQGQHVARVILGEDQPYTDPPFFWSAQYDQAVHYDGHAERFDPPKVDGSVAAYDATVRYEKDGKLLAVATLDRDMASLEAEAAFG